MAPERMPESSDDDSRSLSAAIAPRLMRAMQIARELLPGDSSYGDPLSTTGSDARAVVARRLGEAAAERRGSSSRRGSRRCRCGRRSRRDRRKPGDERLAIVFTDLVGFSDWALEAGDDISLELLRAVAGAIEPPVTDHGGEVVKRLGDGMMAVFDDPDAALDAIFEARGRLEDVEVAGYRPRMRAGMHVGTPRRLAGDYLGVDVNVAARIADGAGGGEVLVSGDALDELDRDRLSARRKLRFKAKGVPSGVTAYSVKPG